MIHDVVRAVYREGYKIEVAFDDGKKGIIDFTKYLRRGGVFKRFKDMDFFRSFAINKELGILTWQNEIDIAPETLYAEATGTPLPDWAGKKKKQLTNKTVNRTATANGRR
jgi:hypothetical protein